MLFKTRYGIFLAFFLMEEHYHLCNKLTLWIQEIMRALTSNLSSLVRSCYFIGIWFWFISDSLFPNFMSWLRFCFVYRVHVVAALSLNQLTQEQQLSKQNRRTKPLLWVILTFSWKTVMICQSPLLLKAACLWQFLSKSKSSIRTTKSLHNPCIIICNINH